MRKKKDSIYNTPKYKAWRRKVYRRDGFQCVWCKAPKGTYIEAHHIYPKAKYPSLMFVASNGITLCKPCHKRVTGSELKWAGFFKKMLEIDSKPKQVKEIKKKKKPSRKKRVKLLRRLVRSTK